MKNLSILFLGGLLLFFGSCVKKEFDTPPIGQLPVGNSYTISQLRQMYADSGAYQFNTDASVYAVVTMDESSGNIYKSAYIQDATDAVNLHLNQTGGLRVGDSIRVYLKGVILSEYKSMFQLDNVRNDSSIVILANQKYLQPRKVSINDLLAGKYQAQLIELDGVQFAESELGKTWADVTVTTGTKRALVNCNSDQIMVRTSNYATFATDTLPQGKGNLIAIAGIYSGDPQLYIRTTTEAQLTGERCTGDGGGTVIDPVDEVNETFDSAANYTDIAIPGWTNIITAGTRKWQGKVYLTDKYVQATGHNSGLSDMECYLITPPVKNQSGDKVLTFKSAMAFWTHTAGDAPLTILASTDFDGSNFETATWTTITATLPDAGGSNYAWVESGDVSLADFVGNVSIAFKYKGSDTESTSIELDDVVISANGGGGGGGGTVIEPVDAVNETFESAANHTDIAIQGWSNIITSGTRTWQGKVYLTDKYVQATGYHSGLSDMECYLITPPVKNQSGDKVLTFKSAMAFWTHTAGDAPLTILASTDFDGSNFETATWTTVTATLPDAGGSNYTWVESGDVSLADFVGNVSIAFKYKGSDTESTSIELDDVVISAH